MPLIPEQSPVPLPETSPSSPGGMMGIASMNQQRKLTPGEIIGEARAQAGQHILEAFYYAATHDDLTGLLNRAGFKIELLRCLAEYPSEFAALYIDLDDLKVTNDTRGHSAGDELLVTAAETMTHQLRTGGDRPHDTIALARIGGDEFVALLPGVQTSDNLTKIGSRLQVQLAEAGVRASIGGDIHKADESGEALLQRVDGLMREQKAARKAVAPGIPQPTAPQ